MASRQRRRFRGTVLVGAAALLGAPVLGAPAAAKPVQAAAERTATTKLSDNTSKRENKRIARRMMERRHGWDSRRQWRCLRRLWAHESSWDERAGSASGAYGIPQALPGSKMASAGGDWRTDARTQIEWGLRYIKRRYGGPCDAWAHFRATGWY